MDFPKIKDFIVKLQKSWEKATKLMEIAKEVMKKQFDKKKWNSQELKTGDNMQLEAKNIHLNRPSKKLNQKRYRPFRILKDIRQGAFQLELLKGWMIYDVFNKNLLIKCREPHFLGQCMDLAPLPTIINEEEEYKVEEVQKHRK